MESFTSVASWLQATGPYGLVAVLGWAFWRINEKKDAMLRELHDRLDLQLIDLEWTLDRTKLILYVLNERGPDCTKLALQAAAAGLGLVEVQPVDENGLVAVEPSGGCGSGGCGCHT